MSVCLCVRDTCERSCSIVLKLAVVARGARGQVIVGLTSQGRQAPGRRSSPKAGHSASDLTNANPFVTLF